MLNEIDDVEDNTVLLEQRIGVLEEENSLLLLRLEVLENALSVLESITLEQLTLLSNNITGIRWKYSSVKVIGS